jgi:hypothetical protein
MGKETDRKTRFWIGFLLVAVAYSLPIGGCAYAGLYGYLTFFVGAFAFSVYLIYRITIRNVKLRYPIVNPEGNADIYSGRMPRPIYEDMQRYPWFFNKKKRQRKLDKQRRTKKKQ